MASAKLYDFNGDLKGNIDLPDALFGTEVNTAVLYDAVKMYLANRRKGSASTKERGEVIYSNRKPWRQKGTGRARSGRRSSPIWRGGGTVFGPRPRDYRYSIPKKMKRVALRSALSDKGGNDNVVVVDGLTAEAPRTKPFADFLKASGLYGKKILFVTEAFDDNVWRSMRNINRVEFMVSRNMNAYEVMNAESLLFTKKALESLEEVFA